jgi:antitoxin CptB
MNENSNKKLIDHPNQLMWACRRGMLELDVLLGNFLKEAYPQLPCPQKIHFIDLLSYSDPELFSWLMGRDEPKNEELMKMINAIRSHARSRV